MGKIKIRKSSKVEIRQSSKIKVWESSKVKTRKLTKVGISLNWTCWLLYAAIVCIMWAQVSLYHQLNLFLALLDTVLRSDRKYKCCLNARGFLGTTYYAGSKLRYPSTESPCKL